MKRQGVGQGRGCLGKEHEKSTLLDSFPSTYLSPSVCSLSDGGLRAQSLISYKVATYEKDLDEQESGANDDSEQKDHGLCRHCDV